MRVIFRMSAIVAALAIATAGLAGCGQRGPLYMPKVPPLPAKPNFETQPQPGQPGENVRPTPETGSVPDTSGTPLSLTPDDTLAPSPNSSSSPAVPASPEAMPDTKPSE